MLTVLLTTAAVFPKFFHITTRRTWYHLWVNWGEWTTHPGPLNCPLCWKESRSWHYGNPLVAKPIVYHLVNSEPCYYTWMLGISGKYNRIVKVNPKYERPYENQVKSFGFYCFGVRVLEEWQHVKRIWLTVCFKNDLEGAKP